MRQAAASRSHYRAGWIVAGAVALLTLAALVMPNSSASAQQATNTAVPTPYVYEDNDPYLTYTGDWNTVQDPRARGGTLHQSRATGAFLRMQFTGPYFKWYGVRGPNRGFARVTVDGTEIQESPFDLYKIGDPVYELIVWRGGLEDRGHTLVIEVLGRQNGASSDRLVDIDQLEVIAAERAPITPTPSITPSPTITPTPTASATPVVTDRPAGSWPIDSRFLRYYVEHDGLRTLGNTMSPPTFFAGHFTQYFEKGRIEDQTGESPDPNFQFQYGLLADELQTARANLTVGGEQSTITYQIVNDLAQPARRVNQPAGFSGGTLTNSEGSVFIPYSQALTPAPGHNVSPIFWPYINRTDIFPGGWLHDIGLPMTEAIPAVVTKGPLTNRSIVVQVFQRTILTYDPLNPGDFQVERANVGTDYRRAFPDRVPQ